MLQVLSGNFSEAYLNQSEQNNHTNNTDFLSEKEFNLYDTHAHLDLLLKQEGFWPNLRDEELVNQSFSDAKDSLNLNNYALDYSPEINIFLEENLQKHSWIVQPTCSTLNFLQCWPLIQNSKIYLLLGSHPEIVKPEFNLEKYLEFQRQAVNFIQSNENLKSRTVGIGECGLDYFYSQDSQIVQTQKALFKSQIELALELDLPLIIHCRNAFEDLFEILTNYPAIHGKFLIHCFTGNLQQATKIVELGGIMAVGGILTFSSAKYLVEAVQNTNLENFVLETDLPFLAPNPFRGKTCRPEMIENTLHKLAEIKQIEASDILIESKLKAQRFFRLNV